MIRCRFFLPTIWLLALLASPLAWAQESVPLTSHKLFLWKVSSDAGEVYLLGSIHVARKDLYPLPSEIEQAFDRSKFLVLEIDQDKPGEHDRLQQIMLEKGIYPEGDSMSHHLSPESAKKVEDFLQKSGIPMAQAGRMRPWVLSTIITLQGLQQTGYNAEYGIDVHFGREAKEKGKEVLELETAESQLGLFSDMSDDLQDQLLLQSLESAADLAKEMELIVSAWRQGDGKELARILLEPYAKHPEWAPLKTRIIDERNAGMVGKIEGYLKNPGPYFVVVGALHLVGDKGILKLLEEKKYKVEQIVRH